MIPTAVTKVLDDPDIRVQFTTDAPDGQCRWCQMHGATNAVTFTWIPRPDVLSTGSAECCLSCVRIPLRWALDDALTGSIVTVEIAGGGA